ncbi:MAG: hypothetical protein M3299_10085 [Thermoproteota archaeon]|nr:hypothetical protein [Thermoproteota archaeon]
MIQQKCHTKIDRGRSKNDNDDQSRWRRTGRGVLATANATIITMDCLGGDADTTTGDGTTAI